MERPTKKLWRKIGLQKNFLEGTSHSDQSKNSLSQVQDSLIKSQCSIPNQSPESQTLKFQLYKAKYGDKTAGSMLKHLNEAKKEGSSSQGSCESPFNKLTLSKNDDYNMIWEIADDTIDLINDKKENQSIVTESEKQSLAYFGNSKQIRFEQQQKDQTIPVKSQNARVRKPSVDSIKIRLHGVEQKQPETNESEEVNNMKNNRNNPLETSLEHIYTLEIAPKQLEKYQKLESNVKRIKMGTLPKIQQELSQLKKYFGIQKSVIQQEINFMREVLVQMMTNNIAEQIQQLTDEIGYLYSENSELMVKLQEKQALIKKTHEEYTKMQEKLTEYTKSITSEHEQKENKIIELENEVNRLMQKLEDFSDLQNKLQQQNNKVNELERIKNQLEAKNNQFQSHQKQFQLKTNELKNKNTELQSTVSVFIANEKKLHELMDQKTFDMSATIIKNQELQWEINELYAKNQQLQYNFRKQLASNIQRLQNQHFNRLNLEKTFLQKEKLKTKDHQIIISTLTNILNESLKHINLNMIEAIQKQYHSETNDYINQIFTQAKLQAQSSTRAFNFGREARPSVELQNQLSPRESENGNSSNKNLRRTGYFGEVGKSNLVIKLDDMQKRLSTEVPEVENNSLDERTKNRSQQKKKLFRGDTFSQISEESFVKEDYAFRTIQPSYPRNQESRYLMQRHSRHQSDHLGRLDLNESITEDLHRVKMSLKQQQTSQNSSREYQRESDTFEIPKNQQVSNNQNVNYSFSEMNWNSEEMDDRSSVTTYEKSQNYNRDQYPHKTTYAYYRAPTDRSQRSEKSNSERQDIIQKIKERVRLKLQSKEKYKKEESKHEPTYGSQVNDNMKRHSYQQTEYEEVPKVMKKEDMILADFYERHSIKNPVVTQHQTERKMSPISASRSPSNTRTRSPSSSSTSRVTSTNRVGITKYTPVTGNGTYGVRNETKSPVLGSVSRNAYSKSMIDRPEFSSYKRMNQGTTGNVSATYQTSSGASYQAVTGAGYQTSGGGSYQTSGIGGYQPKSGLYSMNRGESQSGSSYGKKY